MGQAEQTAAPSVETTPEVATEEVAVEETNESEELEASDDGASSHGDEAAPEVDAKGPLKFKRKINGKLIEATEDELWKHYGLEVSARERLEEAAAQRKEIESQKDALAKFFDALQKRPETAFDLLNEMGHDAKKIARQMVLEEMEFERMSPEQKRLVEAEKKLKDYEEKEAVRKQKEEEHQESLIRREFEDKVDLTLSEAFKLSGLQPKPKTIARMAEACQTLVNASNTGDLPSPQQIVDKFLSYQRQDIGELIGEQDPEKLVELGLLNDNSIDQIVKWHLQKNKAKLPSFGTSSKGSNSKNSTSTKKKIGVNDFFNKL